MQIADLGSFCGIRLSRQVGYGWFKNSGPLCTRFTQATHAEVGAAWTSAKAAGGAALPCFCSDFGFRSLATQNPRSPLHFGAQEVIPRPGQMLWVHSACFICFSILCAGRYKLPGRPNPVRLEGSKGALNSCLRVQPPSCEGRCDQFAVSLSLTHEPDKPHEP